MTSLTLNHMHFAVDLREDFIGFPETEYIQ